MSVVVTGVGIVCPAGVGSEAVLTRLTEGPLCPEEGSDALPEPAVLRVPGFDPKRYVKRRKDLKLMARANQLAVAAARLAADEAGLSDADLADAAIYLAVGLEPGSVDDLVPPAAHSVGEDGRTSVKRLAEEGMRWMHPLSSLKTLPNMSVAHTAIALGAMGPSLALCGEGADRAALERALADLRDGRARVALVGGSESFTDFTDRIRMRRLGERGPASEGAAVLVLERAEDAAARGVSGRPLYLADEVPDWAPGGATATADALATLRGKGRAPALLPARREAVAITAVGLASPLGNDLETFAERLLAGESAVAPIRSFDASEFPVRNACEVREHALDMLPPSLAVRLAGLDDRKAELAVAAALRASAGGRLPADALLAYATGLSSISLTELHQDWLPFIVDGAYDHAAAVAAEGTPRQAPWRHQVDRPAELLRRHLGIAAAPVTHFSACAAATAALGDAADQIRSGRHPVALAGGADSMVHPFGLLPFILLGATSEERDPARAGRPFEADRDGFVMGEGAAFFVVEPVARARAEGREILGLLLGWGSSTDAYNVTAPHPDGLGAERAMRAALADARLDPGAVDYVNAHGTGTPLNDGVEAAAIRRVFGDSAPPVSSTKAQVGHCIAAAGALELAACVAALRGGRLPPNAHLGAVDPKIDLDLVEREGRTGTPGVLLSNSFGFGGQNACLALAHPDWDGCK